MIKKGIILLFFAFSAAAAVVEESPDQRRVLDLAAQLRCAVCQSQSVAESDSELAVEMKRVIAEKFDQGASEAEVVDYFVARYGDYILMKPRSDGAGRLLWLAPALILMMVVTVVVLQIRQRSRINPAAEKEFQARELNADEQSRLAALRKRDS